MYAVIILLLLINCVQTQQDLCSCSCCTGQSCSPSYSGTVTVPSCTLETCRLYCRNTFSQCQIDYPNGQLVPQCSTGSTSLAPLYNCQCNCCRTGVATCIPSLVGYSTAYTCQESSCSIACARQYSFQCPSDQYGQTIGICTGNITTTISTTTTTAMSSTSGSGSSNTCVCMCCQSGMDCRADIEVGYAQGNQCSSTACTTACQNQYPSACPSSPFLGQTNGTCISQNHGNNRCRCQCCGTNGCSSEDLYSQGDCAPCRTLCQQRCGSITNATYTCQSNKSTRFSSRSFLFLIILFILLINDRIYL